MFDKFFEDLSKVKYQTLLLLIGSIFITLSSFEIIDITKLNIVHSPNPSYPVFAIGVIFVLLATACFILPMLKDTCIEKNPGIPPSPVYYKFLGLDRRTTEQRHGSVFQDFNVKRSGEHSNINAIQYLWADALPANTISGEIIEDKRTNIPCLRVRFNHNGGWGCNIAIRPQNEKALFNRCKYLTFEARIPAEEIKENFLEHVGISVRIINGYLQHWEYAFNPREYIILPVEENEWGGTPIKISLYNKKFWNLFTSDGNCDGPTEPDFSIIAAVVLKFGEIPSSPAEPKPGKGVVDIRALQVADGIAT